MPLNINSDGNILKNVTEEIEIFCPTCKGRGETAQRREVDLYPTTNGLQSFVSPVMVKVG